jgi:hypothetical protein
VFTDALRPPEPVALSAGGFDTASKKGVPEFPTVAKKRPIVAAVAGTVVLRLMAISSD